MEILTQSSTIIMQRSQHKYLGENMTYRKKVALNKKRKCNPPHPPPQKTKQVFAEQFKGNMLLRKLNY